MREDEISQMERDLAKLQVIKKKIDAGVATEEEEAYFEIATQNAAEQVKFEGIAGAVTLAAFALFFLVAIWHFELLWFAGEEQSQPAERAPVPYTRQARHVCEQAVLGRLLDTDGARFSQVSVTTAATGDIVSVYDVAGAVIARNSLGGMAQSPFSCTAALSDGRWSTSDVQIGQ